ncbi:MFS general substrate transporter [Saccharata proteae CBS 121410]|uniref:MFS general substrate transporter n=1 Tax=Saccharata proteae CBS 121410 TaxID=1314787 RepID=A0A9P4LZ33_9PEZI|nr:MFS general substrate transporter [Saccharata proteae CBS 121410]
MTGVSIATNATSDPRYEVDWDEEGESGNPREWPLWYRGMIIGFLSYSTATVVMYSTSYASGVEGMKATFNISSTIVVDLGLTTYLFGLALGSVILAPLSEMYGRRPIYLISMFLFVILILPVAMAPNFEAVLISRFFGAIAGAAMIGNAPGTVSDIVNDEYRALAYSVWSIGPMNGPVIGPLVGGFVYQYLGWRWTDWVVMCSSGISFVMVASIKETYAPAILRKRAADKRKETGNERWWSRYDAKSKLIPLLKVNLSRPFIMAFTEPICIFWDIYVAVVYAILYLCFVAYPIVFTDIRGWSPGITGLGYVGIGIGGLLMIACEPLIRRMINAHKPDPLTGKPPPEAMVSIICIGSLLIPLGEFWFAWTSTPPHHWILPILAGVPFGAGNCAVFIYAQNYLTHSYGIYAASALAGNSVLRSIMGGTLPLAGTKMYAAMGPHWAGTLLGLMELGLAPVPFVFYKYGDRIRRKSRLISEMRRDMERAARKKEEMEVRARRIAERDEKVEPVEREVLEEGAV